MLFCLGKKIYKNIHMGQLGNMVFGLIFLNIIILTGGKLFMDVKVTSYLVDWIFINFLVIIAILCYLKYP